MLRITELIKEQTMEIKEKTQFCLIFKSSLHYIGCMLYVLEECLVENASQFQAYCTVVLLSPFLDQSLMKYSPLEVIFFFLLIFIFFFATVVTGASRLWIIFFFSCRKPEREAKRLERHQINEASLSSVVLLQYDESELRTWVAHKAQSPPRWAISLLLLSKLFFSVLVFLIDYPWESVSYLIETRKKRGQSMLQYMQCLGLNWEE